VRCDPVSCCHLLPYEQAIPDTCHTNLREILPWSEVMQMMTTMMMMMMTMTTTTQCASLQCKQYVDLWKLTDVSEECKMVEVQDQRSLN
jgi:hypothetical protein